MRVYELARELKSTSKDLLGYLRSQGTELPSHMSKLSDEQVDQLTKHFSGGGAAAAAPERAARVSAKEPAAAAPQQQRREVAAAAGAESSASAPAAARSAAGAGAAPPAAGAGTPAAPAAAAAPPKSEPPPSAPPAAPPERPPIRTVPLDRIFGPGKGRRPVTPGMNLPPEALRRAEEIRHAASPPGHQRDAGPAARRPFGPPSGDARRSGPPGPRTDRFEPREGGRPGGFGGPRPEHGARPGPHAGPPRPGEPHRGAPAFRSDRPGEARPPRPDLWLPAPEEVDAGAGKDKKRSERVQGKAKETKEVDRTSTWAEEREGGGPRGTERRRVVRTPDRRRPGQSGPGKKFRSHGEPVQAAPPVILPIVEIPDVLSVREFAELTGKGIGEVIKELLKMGQMMTANQTLSADVATKLGPRVGVDVQIKLGRENFVEELSLTEETEGRILRPPVITVMGHVDHGKTSLLDAIRSTDVAGGEAGGITQHIGASVVDHNEQTLTFLDTPGHEAFTSMRSRGAEVTDIVVLVVAADDGVMPQTVEAVDHAKSAKVPIVVAINKMDKPGADPGKVKQELSRYGLNPEEWGGETIFCEVSAKQKTGIDNLLDMLLLVAEMRELRANPDQKAHGTVIEAKLDRGRGPVATVLVQTGTLHVGDAFVVGTTSGKVRAMYSDRAERLNEAGPSTPVEVLGLDTVPDAGDSFHVVDDEREAKEIATRRAIEEKRRTLAEQGGRMKLEDLFSRIQQGEAKELNVILKADVQGSVEAISDALEKLSEVKVKVQVVHRSVGTVSESDVLLATTTNSIIVGYNVVPEPRVRKLAEEKGVDIRLHTIIYEVLDEIRAAMEGLLEPTLREEELGRAEVRNTFSVPKIGTIAGCMVTDGKVQRNAQARLLREGKIIWSGKIASLKRFKDDAREVAQGFECGIGLENYSDIKVGDVIMFHTIVKEKGTLS